MTTVHLYRSLVLISKMSERAQFAGLLKVDAPRSLEAWTRHLDQIDVGGFLSNAEVIEVFGVGSDGHGVAVRCFK